MSETETTALRERIARAACEAGHHAWPTTDGYNDRAEKRAWLQIADAMLAVFSAEPERFNEAVKQLETDGRDIRERSRQRIMRGGHLTKGSRL